MDLSIVIVSWNTRDLLADCLRSVIENVRTFQRFNAETWVVDNASTDSSAQMVREQFPWAQLIDSQVNLGFAKANNQAIRPSEGRYVLILNPDTLVRPGALETLVCFMEQHPEAGAAGAQILNPDGSLQTSCYPAPTLLRELWRLFHLDALWPYGEYHMSKWSVNQPREVDAVLGACLILRRNALDQVGLFDEDYFIYSEEIDLCRRLQEHQWKIYWVPDTQVIHYGGQSTRQVAAEMFLLLYQNKVRYFRKHYGQTVSQLYKLILLTAALVRCLAGPLVWLERAPRREQNLALARNYARLIRAVPGF